MAGEMLKRKRKLQKGIDFSNMQSVSVQIFPNWEEPENSSLLSTQPQGRAVLKHF